MGVYFNSRWLSQCWLKAPDLFVFTLIFIRYADVYRHESGRCHSILPFLTYFLSFHLSMVFYWYSYIEYPSSYEGWKEIVPIALDHWHTMQFHLWNDIYCLDYLSEESSDTSCRSPGIIHILIQIYVWALNHQFGKVLACPPWSHWLQSKKF